MALAIKRIFVVTAGLILLLLYFVLDARKGGFPECPFHSITGWYCPGCGSQRALSALIHGNVIEAIRYNVLLIIFLPLLVYSAFINLRYAGSQKIKLWYNPVFVKIILAAIICFWIFRNIPVFPFSILAPLIK